MKSHATSSVNAAGNTEVVQNLAQCYRKLEAATCGRQWELQTNANNLQL